MPGGSVEFIGDDQYLYIIENLDPEDKIVAGRRLKMV